MACSVLCTCCFICLSTPHLNPGTSSSCCCCCVCLCSPLPWSTCVQYQRVVKARNLMPDRWQDVLAELKECNYESESSRCGCWGHGEEQLAFSRWCSKVPASEGAQSLCLCMCMEHDCLTQTQILCCLLDHTTHTFVLLYACLKHTQGAGCA